MIKKIISLLRMLMKWKNQKPNFIKEAFPTSKVYSVWLHQLDLLEKSTITTDPIDSDKYFDKGMDIVYKLFPIIDSISLTLFNSLTGRKYLKELGYTGKESHLIYLIFRNGITHTLNPYKIEYKNGTVSWGMMSSSGSSGFTPHYPGYKDIDHPEFNEPADKAFEFTEHGDGIYHASLSLDRLVAHIKYDLIERQKNETHDFIDVVVGEKFDEKI